MAEKQNKRKQYVHDYNKQRYQMTKRNEQYSSNMLQNKITKAIFHLSSSSRNLLALTNLIKSDEQFSSIREVFIREVKIDKKFRRSIMNRLSHHRRKSVKVAGGLNLNQDDAGVEGNILIDEDESLADERANSQEQQHSGSPMIQEVEMQQPIRDEDQVSNQECKEKRLQDSQMVELDKQSDLNLLEMMEAIDSHESFRQDPSPLFTQVEDVQFGSSKTLLSGEIDEKDLIKKFYTITNAERYQTAIYLSDPMIKQRTRSEAKKSGISQPPEQAYQLNPVSYAYSELPQVQMDKLLERMHQCVPFDNESVFLDIGSGLGKPQWHAAIAKSCTAFGIEANQNRIEVAERLKQELKDLKEFNKIAERVQNIYQDAGKIQNFVMTKGVHPSHVYSFNARFTDGDRKASVDALNKTQYKVAAFSTFPATLACKYGMKNAQLDGQIQVTTLGGEQFTFYIYKKVKYSKDHIIQEMLKGAIQWIKRYQQRSKIDEAITTLDPSNNIGFQDYKRLCYKEICGVEPKDPADLFLNDVILNYYIALIVRDEIYVKWITLANTYYGSLMMNTDMDKKKASKIIKKLQLTELPVALPIHHQGNHWLILIIDPVKKTFTTIDPLPMIKTLDDVKNLVKERSKFLEEAFNDLNSWRYEIKSCPQQTNLSDCGVLLCKNLRKVLKRGSVDGEISYDWTDELAIRERKHLLLQIYQRDSNYNLKPVLENRKDIIGPEYQEADTLQSLDYSRISKDSTNTINDY